MSSLDYFNANDVEVRLDYPSLIKTLRRAFQSKVESPTRSHYKLSEKEENSPELLIMPAWTTEAVSVKLATVFPENANHGLPAISGLVLLFDAETGEPLAVIDAAELTARRTAAASALASSYLSRADSKHLVIVGTGRLARYLAEAHSTVRDLSRISLWGRDKKKAEQVLVNIPDPLKQECDFACVDDLANAVAEADIVSVATRAISPVVQGSWLSKGVHLDLVGGYRPDMREVDNICIKRASLFADSKEAVLAEAGDFIQPIESGLITAHDIKADLSQLCSGLDTGRLDNNEITLFKSVGVALEDLAAASLLVSKA